MSSITACLWAPLPCLASPSACTLSTYDSVSLTFQPPALLGNRMLLWNMMLCLILPYVSIYVSSPPTLWWGTEQLREANSHSRFVSIWACIFQAHIVENKTWSCLCNAVNVYVCMYIYIYTFFIYRYLTKLWGDFGPFVADSVGACNRLASIDNPAHPLHKGVPHFRLHRVH